MVTLMDRLLKLENLDLHLTPYRVLATGHDEGMLEFIPSKSLAQVFHKVVTPQITCCQIPRTPYMTFTASQIVFIIKLNLLAFVKREKTESHPNQSTS